MGDRHAQRETRISKSRLLAAPLRVEVQLRRHTQRQRPLQIAVADGQTRKHGNFHRRRKNVGLIYNFRYDGAFGPASDKGTLILRLSIRRF
jgi:hypothetical protein